MNTESNAMPGSPLDSPASRPPVLAATRPFYWSVRRELWENRSVYIAPLVVAAVFLFGFSISTVRLPNQMLQISALDPAHQHEAIAKPYDIAAGLIMAAGFIVALFYSLEALHGERRDRGILFWKSMPVSDLTTVLSKATIPIVLIPLLTFVLTVATQAYMLLLSSAVLAASGRGVAMLWSQVSLFQIWSGLLYHLVAIHGLWYAPLYGWLLLVSSWARRVPVLWAALPLVVIGVVEKIGFNTSYFASMLLDRVGGGPQGVPFTSMSKAMDPMMHHDPVLALASPGLWIGLAVAAAFLFGATRLRRNRGQI